MIKKEYYLEITPENKEIAEKMALAINGAIASLSYNTLKSNNNLKKVKKKIISWMTSASKYILAEPFYIKIENKKYNILRITMLVGLVSSMNPAYKMLMNKFIHHDLPKKFTEEYGFSIQVSELKGDLLKKIKEEVKKIEKTKEKNNK